MSKSMFEMDRRIHELEHAMSANDEYLQKVEALNAELQEALEKVRTIVTESRMTEERVYKAVNEIVDCAIAKGKICAWKSGR